MLMYSFGAVETWSSDRDRSYLLELLLISVLLDFFKVWLW